MPMNKILKNKSLLIFDLDETIYDHQHSSKAGLIAVTNSFPLWNSKSIDELENLYFNDLHQNYLKVIDGHISNDDSHILRFQKLAKHFNLQFKANDFTEMINLYNYASKNTKRPIPDAPETIFQLKERGYSIGLITNGSKDHQKQKIKFCGIQDHMDFALISEEVGIRKPAKEIFQRALDLAGVKPENALMIGDSWDSDIIGAQAANIQPIWVNRGRHENLSPHSVIEIKHINQLLK